jgi:two-component system, LytTR family, sensor kinase
MMTGITKENIKEGALISLKITIIFGLLFTIINQNFDLKSIVASFVISGIYSFGLGFGQGLLNDYLSVKWSWIDNTKQRVWSGVVATISYTVPVVLFINYMQFVIIPGKSSDAFLNGEYLWTHLFFTILSFGISAFLHARSFMIEWKKSVKQESTQQQIVAKTETAKFESLKSQIDPHFLFNSLNVLTSLISENPSQAEKFTTKLSKVYRYVLEQRNKDLIPLSEELTFAKTYMELLGMRFEDAVQFHIPETVSNQELKIVPLSLQLLLENAVKHNVVSPSKPLTISIYEDQDYLVIENNVNPKEAVGKSTKVGLQNIADRYGLITQKSVQIENNNKTFKVRIPLLIKMNNIMYQENIENSKYVRAVEKVERLKEFYQSLASYCIVIPVLIFINLQFSPRFYWFWFPLIFWGISLIFKYLEVQNFNIFLGKNWEERKIKELMNQEKQ